MEPNNNDSQRKEEICVHVVPSTDGEPEEMEENVFRFDIPPFRQTFFRYSMYGQSEVVRSSSFVYASHHFTESSWLDIRKISVGLVGSNEVPNLTLFSPTVKEVYFMGHIKYPVTAFTMLTQLGALEKVSFNIGFGGMCNEFHETPDEFLSSTPALPSVTSAEFKLCHNLHRGCTADTRFTLDRLVESVLKHSSDSFPNLQNITVDLPVTALFHESVESLINSNEILRSKYDVRVLNNERKIQVDLRTTQVTPPPSHLPFDPYAHFPSESHCNFLRMVNSAFASANSYSD